MQCSIDDVAVVLEPVHSRDGIRGSNRCASKVPDLSAAADAAVPIVAAVGPAIAAVAAAAPALGRLPLLLAFLSAAAFAAFASAASACTRQATFCRQSAKGVQWMHKPVSPHSSSRVLAQVCWLYHMSAG